MSTIEKLLAVQAELKAPKGQYNSFGKYKYRSCEDILEAVKPILKAHGASITISDELVQIGNRIYVKATARFWDVDDGGYVNNTAFAREPDTKKGMDESQITGTASSYARKYALNGLLLIDDTKDADTDENRNERENRTKRQKEQPEPVEDRTGEPAYPDEDKMVEDLKAVAAQSEKVNSLIQKLLETNNARDLSELAFMNINLIKAWHHKLCQR